MKIDRKKLIELLVKKTGMDKKEIESQMDQLIDRILDAAERGKALEIKEFGLFYFDQNNELKFEPSEELSTEISFKYAGMRPVELKPERNTGIPPEIDEFEPSDSENDVRILNTTVQKQESIGDTAPAQKTPAQKTTTTKAKTGASYKKTANRKNDRSFVWGLLAFLLVLIIGAVIYFMQSSESEQLADTQQPVSEQQLPPVDPLPDASEPDETIITDDETAVESDLEQTEPDETIITDDEIAAESDLEQTEPDEVPVVEEPEQPLYGLNGAWNDSINDHYSIVLHSFYNETRAVEVAADYENDGYRTFVSERIINDLDVWRVSVGQFTTIEEAQNSAATLPEPYNNQNFIQRIQQ